MIFNFFARIFGKSTYKSSEIITTAIVENDSNADVDDDGDSNDGHDDITISSNKCYLMAAPAAAALQSTMPCERMLNADAKLTTSTNCNYRRLSMPNVGRTDGDGGECGAGCGRNLSVQFQRQTCHKTNQTIDMNKSKRVDRGKSTNGMSIYTVYTLFVMFFICICTIAVLLMAYVNRMNDVVQLRADLNGKFVGRDDIDVIVRNILHELRIDVDGDDDGMPTLKPR